MISIDQLYGNLSAFGFHNFQKINYYFFENEMDVDGFPIRTSLKRYQSLEQLIIDTDANMTRVASVTSRGQRQTWFATKYHSDLRKVFEKLDKHIASFSLEIQSSNSVSLLNLLPTEVEKLFAENEDQINDLEEIDNNSSIVRMIDHSIILGTHTDVKGLCKHLSNLGYQIGKIEGAELVASKMGDTTLKRLNRETFQLHEISKRFEAKYDGWACLIV